MTDPSASLTLAQKEQKKAERLCAEQKWAEFSRQARWIAALWLQAASMAERHELPRAKAD